MNIPQPWLDVLRRLHDGGHPEAFIGGGALRDLDNGKPVKDVDIFLRHIDRDTLNKLLPEMMLAQPTTGNADEYEEHFSEIESVYEGTPADGGAPYNIIVCDGPCDSPYQYMMHHLHRFDLGICRIGYRYGLVMLPDYTKDKADRTITIVNNVRPEASMARAVRIRERAYRDWRIVANPLETSDGMEQEDL